MGGSGRPFPHRSEKWSPELALALVLLCPLAFLVRGFPFFGASFPSGGDYGHHVFLTELYLESGRVPSLFPYYQLGETRWAELPGTVMLYGLLSASSGLEPIQTILLTPLLAVVETCGTFLLALRLLRRTRAAAFAALVGCLLPSGAAMASWSGYANLIALALLPAALWTWIDYWQVPSHRRLAVTVLAVVGVSAVHHVTALWLGATLMGFCAVELAASPRRAVRKLVPVLAASLLVAAPVLASLLRLRDLGGSTLFGAAGRFDSVRITWSESAQLLTPLWPLLFAGTLKLVCDRRRRRPERALIGAYLGFTVLLGFGWLIGVEFFYPRALYFLALPIALGAGQLLLRWPSALKQQVFAAVLVGALGTNAVLRGRADAEYYSVLNPRVVEGTRWLAAFSRPGDVIVSSSALAFHLPRLLKRRLLAALDDRLIGNPEELAAARDARRVLSGGSEMEEVLDRRGVRYLILSALDWDVAPEARRRLDRHRRLALVFRNSSVIVYAVWNPGQTSRVGTADPKPAGGGA